MQTEYKNHPNTIRKDFERLKMVYASADEKQMINENVFLRYKLPTRQKKKNEALTFEQIKKIDSLSLLVGSRHFHVNNYFLFSFYDAGIRFVDLYRLKWKNIEDGNLKYLMSKNQKNKAFKWKNIKLSD